MMNSTENRQETYQAVLNVHSNVDNLYWDRIGHRGLEQDGLVTEELHNHSSRANIALEARGEEPALWDPNVRGDLLRAHTDEEVTLALEDAHVHIRCPGSGLHDGFVIVLRNGRDLNYHRVTEFASRRRWLEGYTVALIESQGSSLGMDGTNEQGQEDDQNSRSEAEPRRRNRETNHPCRR